MQEATNRGTYMHGNEATNRLEATNRPIALVGCRLVLLALVGCRLVLLALVGCRLVLLALVGCRLEATNRKRPLALVG
jgi:hypothetical protein